jgi:hypothetical protein
VRKVVNYPLWLGHVGDVRNVDELFDVGIRVVIDLAINELPANLPRELVHCRFPLVDGAGNPRWLLRAAAETVAMFLRAEVPTLVYCGAGMSRTPTIAAAGLSLASGCSTAEALASMGSTGGADVSPALWADVLSALA